MFDHAVCGRDDFATSLFVSESLLSEETSSLSEETSSAIKGSELIVIEKCGHLITMEKP